MKTRIAKVDEFQFLTCLKYGLWGGNTNLVKSWNDGDVLVLSIDKEIAAIAEIVGQSFVSDDVIWDNGFFGYRIKLNFIHILAKEDRIPIQGDIKELLIKAWGKNYGCGILNKTPLPADIANIVLDTIKKKSNNKENFIKNIEGYIEQAKQEREKEAQELAQVGGKAFKRYKDKVIDIE
jgi:hypothetical protein